MVGVEAETECSRDQTTRGPVGTLKEPFPAMLVYKETTAANPAFFDYPPDRDRELIDLPDISVFRRRC